MINGRSVAALITLLVIAVILGIYHTTVESMVAIWNRSDTYAHGYLILPFSVYMIWKKRAMLSTIQYRPDYMPLSVLVGLGAGNAEFGLRLARFGYRSVMFPSTTYEEAPARFGAWLKQRTRWMKGWMQTWAVHMSTPVDFWRSAGPRGFLTVNLLVGGNILGALVYPILLTQIALIALVAKLALNWWRNRQSAASFASGPSNYSAGEVPPQQPSQPGGGNGGGFGSTFGSALGPGGGQPQPVATPIEIKPDDYEAFERLLSDVQAAWSNEDVEKLHKLATPEMVSYFTDDLAANKQQGVVNKTTDVKLLQGDLAEAWREGVTDYATVAMRFSLIDKTIDCASGKVVEGSDQPVEATEVWTFARRPGEGWELSAIQQT